MVDCRSPDKDGGDLPESAGICGGPWGSVRNVRASADTSRLLWYLLASVESGGNPSNNIKIGIL